MAVARNKRNLVKKGQIWQKSDTGVLITIIGKSKDPFWITKRIDGRAGTQSKKRCHHISLYDLLKHWNKIS